MGAFPTAKGAIRDAEDRICAALIEQLLTRGRAMLPRAIDLAPEIARLEPFNARGLVLVRDDAIELLPHALPYARTVAAVFDRYRQTNATRFSSAI